MAPASPLSREVREPTGSWIPAPGAVSHLPLTLITTTPPARFDAFGVWKLASEHLQKLETRQIDLQIESMDMVDMDMMEGER